MSHNIEISIVVTVSPSLDEMQQFINSLNCYYPTGNVEIVFVNDLGISESDLKVLSLPDSIGFSFLDTGGVGHLDATILGLGAARGRYIVSIDPDMFENIRDIPAFIDAAEKGAVLVYGIRVFRDDVPAYRFLLSRIYNKLLQVFFDSPVSDINVPMLLVKSELVPAIIDYKGTSGYLKLFMPDYVGDKFSEIEIRVSCRNKKKSAYSFFSLVLLCISQFRQVLKYFHYSRRTKI